MTTFNGFSHSRAVIDVLAEVRDEVATNMSDEEPCIILINVGYSTVVIVPLTRGSVDCDVNIFTEGCIIVVLATMVSLEVVVPASNAIGLLSDMMIDTLAGTVLAVVTGIGIGVLASADANMSPVIISSLEFTSTLVLSGETSFLGWEACSCWTIATSDFRPLHARMPSYHVWPEFMLPAIPQFPNQEPPRPQQLILLDFRMVPHLGHTALLGVVVSAGVGIWRMVKGTQLNTLRKPLVSVSKHAYAAFNLALTFASLQALKPTVNRVSVTSTSTIPVPSTTGGTTTYSPEFLERAAL